MKILILLLILVGGIQFVSAQTQKELPLLTTKIVREALRDQSITWLNDKGRVSSRWTFGRDELIELDIIDVERFGDDVNAILDIRTGTSANSVRARFNPNGPCVEKNVMEVTGRIKARFHFTGTDYALFEIVNLTARYRWLD